MLVDNQDETPIDFVEYRMSVGYTRQAAMRQQHFWQSMGASIVRMDGKTLLIAPVGATPQVTKPDPVAPTVPVPPGQFGAYKAGEITSTKFKDGKAQKPKKIAVVDAPLAAYKYGHTEARIETAKKKAKAKK